MNFVLNLFIFSSDKLLVHYQIVPFLTLGLGVDDMFLLLYNYNELMDKVKDHEIGTKH